MLKARAVAGLLLAASSLVVSRVDARQSGTPTARIAGTVISEESKTPLADASVLLQSSEGGVAFRSAATARDGRFAFEQLAAGRYWITVIRPGFSTAIYGQKRPGRPGRPIDVVDRQAVDGVTVGMIRGAVLTGTVFGSDGQPVVDATVSAFRYEYRDGVRDVVAVTGGGPVIPTTDDRGVYRITGLDRGDYFVGVRVARTAQAGEPSVAANPMRAAAGLFGGDLVFYPGTASLANTSAVKLALGEERGALDIRVSAEAVTTVSGTVTTAEMKRGGAIVMLAMDGNYMVGALRSDATPDGRFLFPTVPGGEYALTAHSLSGGGSTNPIRVVVADKPIVNLDIQLMPTHALSGHAVWRGATAPSGRPVQVTLHDTRVGLGSITQTRGIGSDGTIRFEGLLPGRYFLTVDQPPGWSLKSIELAGRDLTDSPFDYDGGDIDDVTIEFTAMTTELRGTLTDSGMRAAADCTVVAFPEDERLANRFSRRIQASQTSSDGLFLMRGLPPGDYLLGVAEDIETGAWMDPAVLRTLRPSSTRVHLNEGEQKTVALKFAR